MWGGRGIPKDSDPREFGDGRLQQLQPFPAYLRLVEKRPRDVPTRSGQGGSEAGGDRIAFKIAGDDGDRCRPSLRSLDGSRPQRDDHIDAETDQFGSELRESIGSPFGKAIINGEVAVLDVAELAHALTECAQEVRQRAGELIQEADPRDLPLLRLNSERCSEHAPTHQRDERSPVHQRMTSSARTRSDCGIVSPRALAVLKLMINSNLVGCSTGKSAGLAPLRILST